MNVHERKYEQTPTMLKMEKYRYGRTPILYLRV